MYATRTHVGSTPALNKLTATLGGSAPSGGYDQLDVSGTVSLSGAIVQANLTFVPAIAATFTLIQNDGTDALA